MDHRQIFPISAMSPPRRLADLVQPQDSMTPTNYNGLFAKVLDCQRDIYDLRDRVRETQIGMELCLEIDPGQIYCLVCRVYVAKSLENYSEHLCLLDHCENLYKLSQHTENCTEFPDGFTKLDVAKQYMESVDESTIRCLVCNVQLESINRAIWNHIDTVGHREKWETMRTATNRIFERISSRMHCDWYKVQKYSCIPCSLKFDTELQFADHLTSANHGKTIERTIVNERTLIYDFCAVCALLWYGYRSTYATHCDGKLHNWYVRNGRSFVTVELPKLGQLFLSKWGIQNENAIDYVDFVSAKEESLNEILVMDLRNRVQMIFPDANVWAFGLRSTPHCTIDVFLGCKKMNDGRLLTDDQILYFMMSVSNFLDNDPQCWQLRRLVTGGRSPIINANHKKTGLSCDITFDNRLMLGGTKLIELFDDIFPSCRILLHYLNQWLAYCELRGSERISNYALYWLLIFYLQKELILPSLAALSDYVAIHKIDGNPVGRRHSFDYTNANCNVKLKELVIGFFKFYSNFDFRHDVACPLIGYSVKKRSFVYTDDLPLEMSVASAHVDYSNIPTIWSEFSIDSPMCLQDPFNLDHNLTKNPTKYDLNSFRTYCSKTVEYFCSR